MKRLLALAFLLLAVPAQAQEYRVLYSGVDQASGLTGVNRNNLAFSNDMSYSLTGSMGSFVTVARVVCTAACYIAMAPTGSASLTATTVTGVYMPANEPEHFIVDSSTTFAVIGAAGTGNLIVHELTK